MWRHSLKKMAQVIIGVTPMWLSLPLSANDIHATPLDTLKPVSFSAFLAERSPSPQQAKDTPTQSSPSTSNNNVSPQSYKANLNAELEQLKLDIIELNRELSDLEDELAGNTNAQLKLFFTLAPDANITVKNLSIELNDRTIGQHNYDAKELSALKKGTSQRLFTTSLKEGDHQAHAVITGEINGKAYKNRFAFTLSKTSATNYVQLELGQSPSGKPALNVHNRTAEKSTHAHLP